MPGAEHIPPSFVLDVHLGKLARLLRMLGFDTRYRNNYSDPEIIDISLYEKRFILTRDRGILENRAATRGYFVEAIEPEAQLREVLLRFGLRQYIHPFHRCMVCNGIIEPVEKAAILERLQPKTIRYYQDFYRCSNCGKIYWKGSHYEKMEIFLQEIMEA